MVEAILQYFAEWLRQRNPARIFQVVKHLAERIIEHQGRSCEVKGMIASSAKCAQALYCSRRDSALRADRRSDRHKSCPTIRTGRSPTPLPNLCLAQDTRDWKENVENGVEQRDAKQESKGSSIIAADCGN
jgi:hypothetical protein